jgi:hypothetical protein
VVVRSSVWAPEWRALTVGLLVMVTLVASEALAVATALPLVARDLNGVGLYGYGCVISAFLLGTLVGLVVGGEESTVAGPATPFVVAEQKGIDPCAIRHGFGPPVPYARACAA